MNIPMPYPMKTGMSIRMGIAIRMRINTGMSMRTDTATRMPMKTGTGITIIMPIAIWLTSVLFWTAVT